MSDKKMQERFEFFYGLKWEQVNDFEQRAWKAAWLSSRDTMVIELPICYCADPEAIDYAQSVVEHIESLGLKVKP